MAKPAKFAHIVYRTERELLTRPAGPPAPIPREHGLGA